MSRHRGNPFRVGLASIAALVILVLLALTINVSFGLPFNLSLFPPGQDYSVSAAFSDANGVNRGADVVIAGHTVGQVTAVEVQGRQALVTMRVARHYAPLHRFTTARIRYSTLLAQKYVEITPVSGGPELRGGGQISSDNTLSPVDFDQFLSALDPETRSRLQVLVQQAGGGVEGRQQVINDLLTQLNGLSQESLPPLSTFHQHDPDLDRIVANLAVVSKRLAQSHQQLGDLVGSMSDVTGTLAQNDRALASLIRNLGNVMGDFNATLAGNEQNLHTTVVQLDPLLAQLNGTLGIVYTDLHGSLAAINTNTNVLTPESVSAVSEPGFDGQGNVLRQYYVVNPACDQVSAQPNPDCKSGTSATQQPGAAPPALTVPSLPNLPLCIPTPSPPKLTTPSILPLPCPSVSAPVLPTPSCMPATPKLPQLPTPTPSLCPSLPGLPLPSLPLGAIPDWLGILLGAR
ncbi:MAG TPA: MCE family protein [Candidatus Dormibacteraeota bacterium]|jgi:phospholipid/cholesterol/gamma-HCH transport system substrate-binding protein